MNREELIKRAIEIVKSGAVKGFTGEILKKAANENITDFINYIQNISEQAWDENSINATIKTYGEELVKISMLLFKRPENYNIINLDETKVKGGKADKLSIEDIAKRFNYDLKDIKKQLEMGVKVELEHTKNKEMAKDIAMDHLSEIPDYYTRLSKMEKEGKKDYKSFIKESLRRKLNENKYEDDNWLNQLFDYSTNMQELFDYYNNKLFGGMIKPVDIVFSNRIKNAHGRTFAKYDTITKKSYPYLIQLTNRFKYTNRAMLNIFVHELIHAYFFSINKPNEGHGFNFQRKMDEINIMNIGLKISIKVDQDDFNNAEYHDEYKNKNKSVIIFRLRNSTRDLFLTLNEKSSEKYINNLIYFFIIKARKEKTHFEYSIYKTNDKKYLELKISRPTQTSIAFFKTTPEDSKTFSLMTPEKVGEISPMDQLPPIDLGIG